MPEVHHRELAAQRELWNNPRYQVQLPAIATGVKANSAALLAFLKK